MKKVINGKLYDTNTATEIGVHSYSYPGDFSYYSENLYKKHTGEFFLCGEGGAMSKYSRSCGQNSWSGGSDIIPLTLAEAKEWGEKYMDGDDYILAFGPVEE